MTLGDQFGPQDGRTLKDLSWKLEPNLCARYRDAKRAAVVLSGYLEKEPRKAIKICLDWGEDQGLQRAPSLRRADRAKGRASEVCKMFVERLREARWQQGRPRAPGLSRKGVREAIAGVCRDLTDDATRTLSQIEMIVRIAIMADGVTVMATMPSGHRRQLARTELAEAWLDVENNAIRINDAVWKQVEIGAATTAAGQVPVDLMTQTPVGSAPPPPPPPAKTPTMLEDMVTWLRTVEGQAFRNQPNRQLFTAFKTAYPDHKGRKGNKTTIGKARKTLGWAPRRGSPNTKGNRAITLPLP